MTDHWNPSHVQNWWKHIWIHGFVIGVGVVLAGFLVWFSILGTPSSSTSSQDDAAPEIQTAKPQAPPGEGPAAGPPIASPAPADSTPPVKTQLAQVLTEIKEANQKKDLPRLLRHYSPGFPELQQRARHISKGWETYNYPKMEFEITEVRLLDDQTASARVTWDVEAHDIGTQKDNHLSKTYSIRFTRESGQWRIKALDQAE